VLYRINLFRNGKLASTEQWDGASFEDARKHITTAVETGVADWAEVRNSAGTVLCRQPSASIMPKAHAKGRGRADDLD
jgi:hypothetical protein